MPPITNYWEPRLQQGTMWWSPALRDLNEAGRMERQAGIGALAAGKSASSAGLPGITAYSPQDTGQSPGAIALICSLLHLHNHLGATESGAPTAKRPPEPLLKQEALP